MIKKVWIIEWHRPSGTEPLPQLKPIMLKSSFGPEKISFLLQHLYINSDLFDPNETLYHMSKIREFSEFEVRSYGARYSIGHNPILSATLAKITSILDDEDNDQTTIEWIRPAFRYIDHKTGEIETEEEIKKTTTIKTRKKN